MSEANAPQTAAKRPQGRSPSYPALTLQKAIERVGQLYDKEKQYPTPVETVVKHWNYSGVTGPAGLTVAALKKFGLLTDEGSKTDRRVRVTDLAVQILNHPNAEKRQEGIRAAALAPTAHSELWAEYGANLPSDQHLTWTLTRDRGYTESGARDFIKEYKSTIDFAGLLDTPPVETSDDEDEEVDEDEALDRNEGEPENKGDRADKNMGAQRRQSPKDGRSAINIPLPNGEFVVVEGKLPLSEQEWAYFLAVLNVMKPGFTGGGTPTTDDGD